MKEKEKKEVMGLHQGRCVERRKLTVCREEEVNGV
jgi:hypothetical protein